MLVGGDALGSCHPDNWKEDVLRSTKQREEGKGATFPFHLSEMHPWWSLFFFGRFLLLVVFLVTWFAAGLLHGIFLAPIGLLLH